MKGKILTFIVGVLTAGLALAGTVAATNNNDSMKGNKTLKETETVDGSYYAAGGTVTVAGTVKGDVYCAGQNIIVSGTVEGDVICAGMTVKVSGTVGGDVRLAGQFVTLDGTVGKSASLFGSVVDVTKSSKIGQDLTGAGETLNLDGTVARDAVLAGTEVTLLGAVGRNSEINAQSLTVSDKASVAGNVRYTGPTEGSIAEGSVKGEVEYIKKTNDESNGGSWLASVLYMTLALLFLSLILVLAMPQVLNNMAVIGQKRLGMVIASGLLLLVATPFVAVLTAITVIGIPLAIILMLVWVVLLLVSGPVTAFYLGRLLLRKYSNNAIASMMAGALVLVILLMIPIVNIIAGAAMVVLGLGMAGLNLISRTNQKKFSYSVK